MDKAIEYVGVETEFDFGQHILISNRVGKVLAQEIKAETGLLNNPNYFDVNNEIKVENDSEINTILKLLYSEYGGDSVFVTQCENKFYKAIVVKVDNNTLGAHAELHIHFATSGLSNRVVYLLKTKIEVPMGVSVPAQLINYKEFCDITREFAKEFGVNKYKGYRCDYPIFFKINNSGKVVNNDYNVMLNVLRELRKRFEIREWDAEINRQLVTSRFAN